MLGFYKGMVIHMVGQVLLFLVKLWLPRICPHIEVKAILKDASVSIAKEIFYSLEIVSFILEL